jgi:hypothetical protein
VQDAFETFIHREKPAYAGFFVVNSADCNRNRRLRSLVIKKIVVRALSARADLSKPESDEKVSAGFTAGLGATPVEFLKWLIV